MSLSGGLRPETYIQYRSVFETLPKIIDTERKNRLLKVCQVPATSATFLAFFSFFSCCGH